MFFAFSGGRLLTGAAALLAGLLGGCTYNGEEPELYRQAPLLTLQYPAVIDNDTVVLGRNQALGLSGFAYAETNALPADLSVYAQEDGAARRRVVQKPLAGINASFSAPWQPASTVRRALVTLELTDKYNQLDSRQFWIRTSALPGSSMGFLVAQPPLAHLAAGAGLELKPLVVSPDPPTELRLYRYIPLAPGGYRLELLSTQGAAAITATPLSATSYVAAMPYIVPAGTESGTQITLLLHLSTQHHLQAELYHTLTVN